ncbi:shikimate dehydrogenase [Buchnera aphidicola]|uniref:shikimate dehydrogenase n=1 Tax=Buchnera aphidicola TaxID=9 RepID=UPI0031B72409
MSNISPVFVIGLFGNPVQHSLSPIIHKHFSLQIKILYMYKTFLCTEKNFFSNISNFFKRKENIGANVTVPFKKKAYNFSKKFLYYSKNSSTVNTLLKISSTLILGNNTDGIGLVYDLKRLKFFKKKNYVLLLGAGGAAKSVIFALLQENCIIYILNRTIKNAKLLVQYFSQFRNVFLFQYDKNIFFDIIINATSSGIFHLSPDFPCDIIHKKICCYDMFYCKKKILTKFLLRCKSLGAQRISDGIGMLVSQAAFSCLHWFGKIPNILKTINFLDNLRK